MSKTLFWYLFRDLLRIFLLASGALAGIMSFGGLLRPLTENGLDAGQVGKMLTYLTPAMMTYSLPVAALFATTVAYGRLAADNELTACRAAGMSYAAIGLPAVVLGLFVAILSLLLLCFIVPVFSLKVEQVIYSNIAQVVVNKIGRDHQIRVSAGEGGYTTVFAEAAHLLPNKDPSSGDESVQLIGPTIVTYEQPDKVTHIRVPKEFYTAESADVHIHSGQSAAGQQGQIIMDLIGGVKFPRQYEGADRSQVGVDVATFPPVALPNPIRENVKFMDIWELARLAADPSLSQRVAIALAELVHRDQERTYLSELTAGEAGNYSHEIRSDGNNGEVFILSTDGPPPIQRNGEVVFNSDAGLRQVKLTVIQGELTTRQATARQAIVHAHADNADDLMNVTLELYDLSMRTPQAGMSDEAASLASWSHVIDVPMSQSIRQMRLMRNLSAYASDPNLRREQVVVNNAVRSELHGRASFAVSCMILVMVGCALGMMFKSGNFLNAFAVSFIPAVLCITLVVAGQQTADHVPEVVGPKFLLHNAPLQFGLILIWSGNALVLALALGLGARLRRR